MAKCTIDPISGLIRTISGKLGNTLFKTYRNGQVRAYLTSPSTNLRKNPPSPAELAARQNFARMASEVARRMRAGDKRPKSIIWNEVKLEWNKGQVGGN